MRKQWQLIVASVVMLAAGWVTTPKAEALILTFQVDKKTTAAHAMYPGAPATKAFDFDDVKLTVDTSTGNGTFAGSITHFASGEAWLLNGALSGIYGQGPLFNPPTLPTDTMFADVLNSGNATSAIRYAEAQFSISTLLANPTYTGPTSWANNSAVGGVDLKINRQVIQGTPYLLIDSGWWGLPQGARIHGNWEWTLTQTQTPPPPVVPEPMTSALFGLGALAGAVGPRVRRKFSRSA